MTEILTGAEMRALEQRAIDRGAVTGRSLMERAGLAVVEAIEAHWPEYKETPQSHLFYVARAIMAATGLSSRVCCGNADGL